MILEPRFWEKVNKDGPVPEHCPELEQCWLWLAGTDKKGYGNYRKDGKILRAHKVSYEAEYGEVPKGLTLDHLCLRTGCVRPSHMEPVTRAENNRRQKENASVDHEIVSIKWNPKVQVKFRKLGKYQRGLSSE